MARRFHVEQVRPGENRLGRDASHHARIVLRLQPGDEVQLFDDGGNIGSGTILDVPSDDVIVRVAAVEKAHAARAIHIASAVPKGNRADWMIEKLAEIGVSRFTPLATERAVVLPEGTGKHDRWVRIAEEAARQSAGAGVMKIDLLTPLDRVLEGAPGVFGATAPPAEPMLQAIATAEQPPTILIGPEGGWTDAEVAKMTKRNWRAVTFGPTILRIETAAMAAAVIAMQRVSQKDE